MNTHRKNRIYDIIFEADSHAGKAFDVSLIIMIILSSLAVMLESMPELQGKYGRLFMIVEWIITGLFTLEYLLRIAVVKKPLRYIFSFYGIIDLLSILPSYLGLFVGGTRSLLVIRILRLIRIFRIFKLSRYTNAGQVLSRSLKASQAKIGVFFTAVLTVIIIIGTIMYLVEGADSGFTSIPKSMYWAIVTITTVGYGDIAPITGLGQFLASLTMIIGYTIIAVPTGIVAAEMNYERRRRVSTQVCPHCLKEGHEPEAVYCSSCGEKL